MADPRRALRGVAIAVGIVWLPIIAVWGPLPHALTFDDAWYYFQIARNVAGGRGSTFDGLHHTNGYHPLWLGICSLVYLAGFDGLAAVRALLALQLAIWVATAWRLATLLGTAVDGWAALRDRPDADRAGRRCTAVLVVVFALLIGNPYVLKLYVNGMESTLVAFVSVVLLQIAVEAKGDLIAVASRFGLLLAVAFLARTDAAVLAGAAGAWMVVRGIDGRWRSLAALLAPTAVVAAVYLALNAAVLGHPLQISGVMKRVPLTPTRLVVVAVLGAIAVGVLMLGRRLGERTEAARLDRTASFVAATAWYAAGCIGIAAYDLVLSTESYLWHFAPHALWAMTLLLHVVADIAEGAVAERPADDRSAAGRALAVGAVLALPVAGGFLWQTKGFVDPELYGLQVGDRAAAEWIAGNVPDDAVVGSWDAGVVGYFADRPVVNLDGLVNSYEWRDALRAGTPATSAFLRQSGVTVIANHGDPIDGDDPSLRAAVDGLLGDDAGSRAQLVHREDYVFAGSAGGKSGRRPYATFVYLVE